MLPCIDNPDVYSFQSKLTVLDEEGKVTLDPCLFHPRDDLLPGDEGWIVSGDDRYEVFDIRWSHGKPLLELDRPFSSPDLNVHCELDRFRRHDFCRLHTALHVLSWIAMGDRKIARVDERVYSSHGVCRLQVPQWKSGMAQELELQVNSALDSGNSVRWRWYERNKSNRLPPYLAKLFALDVRLEHLRIVGIEDFGRLVCAGPHVFNLGEIGPIRFSRIQQEEDGLVRFDIKLTQEPGKIYQET